MKKEEKPKSTKSLAAFGGLNVILLGLVSLLNDFSSEMILPILPMFIASLGGTGLVIGIIGGMMDGLPNILKVISGYFSDKLRKRKKFIFLGYLNSEIFKFMLIFSTSWRSVFGFLGLEKLGKGIREAPRDALISESMPSEKGRAFGIQRAFDTTGAILGSISVLLLVLFFALGFKEIILISALVGFVSLIPLYFLKEVDSVKKPKRKIGNLFSSLKSLPKNLKLFLIISGIFALANFSYMFFVLKAVNLFATDNGTSGFIVPILLYVFFNIFYAGFAVPFGGLSDKIGREKVLIAGYLLFSLVCLGFLLFSSLISFIILFILYGLVYAMTVGNQRALVSDLSTENLRATSIGAFQTLIGLAAIFSGIIAGFLFDINPNITFIYGIALSLASALLFISFRKRFS